jgi:two-component system cell cycle response regulator
VSSDQPAKGTIKIDTAQQAVDDVARALRAQRRPALIVMSGQKVGERVRVIGNVQIGRSAELELVLPDPGVSLRHAFLEDRGDAFALVDLGSTNGTFVNGQRVVETPIAHGDKLRFGQTVVRFEVQDETDEAYAETIAQRLHVDDLTGLYQRGRFDTELELLLARARDDQRPLSLLVMDLDGVKVINDTHGHLFGAYTISECGKLIGRLLEAPRIACRFGGDEYVAALPDCELEAAVIEAERIRACIAGHPFVHEGIALRPGISIGVAEFPTHATSAEALFHAADEMLYKAKRAGKNRVEFPARGPAGP